MKKIKTFFTNCIDKIKYKLLKSKRSNSNFNFENLVIGTVNDGKTDYSYIERIIGK